MKGLEPELRVEPIPPARRTIEEFQRYYRRMLKRCRQLRLGDLVRFVQMPSCAAWPGVRFDPDTRRLYRRLVARRRPTRVAWIDEWGLPWIEYRFRGPRGRWEFHCLALNDDSWVRVRRRGPRKDAE